MLAFLQRFFPTKKFPAPVLTQLQVEGIIVLEDGVGGSITYRDFRAPGRYSGWRRVGMKASVVLTRVRLMAMNHSAVGGSSPIIDVPLTDPRIRKLTASEKKKGVLSIEFDVAIFHNDWSGTIEYRFRTPQAQQLTGKLHELIG
jgi:hypothetical protein